MSATLAQAIAHVTAAGAPVRSLIAVEGDSDRSAVETLAARLGCDLSGNGTAVVSLGGVTNLGHLLRLLDVRGMDVVVAGLCDLGEEMSFRRQLQAHHRTARLDRAAMERLGFFVCEVDLEDELIRTLGVAAVEDVVAAQGESRSLAIFRRQPAQRARPPTAQLRRFVGTRAGRKIRYGRVLVDALDLDRVPRPLAAVLDHARSGWVTVASET